MTAFQRSRSYFAASLFFASGLLPHGLEAQQVVYNNTNKSLDYRIAESTEFGSELILGGVARTVTEISFEYYGDFTAQGDERCRVRLYTNEKPYDLYRNEPTTLLYESGVFPISPGYRTIRLSGLNVPVRDVVTFTVEAEGLAEGEGMGLLLYNPPSVGRSFNEFWRRDEEGTWRAVFYDFPSPEVKAKAAIRLVAAKTFQLTSARVNQGKFAFGINGLTGSDVVIECSKDLKTWTQVSTNGISSSFMTAEQEIAPGGEPCFFRVRVEK